MTRVSSKFLATIRSCCLPISLMFPHRVSLRSISHWGKTLLSSSGKGRKEGEAVLAPPLPRERKHGLRSLRALGDLYTLGRRRDEALRKLFSPKLYFPKLLETKRISETLDPPGLVCRRVPIKGGSSSPGQNHSASTRQPRRPGIGTLCRNTALSTPKVSSSSYYYDYRYQQICDEGLVRPAGRPGPIVDRRACRICRPPGWCGCGFRWWGRR